MATVLLLDDVSKTYPGSPPVPALRPVTLEIEEGDLIGIVGRSGSGKSTLLNIMGLLDAPTAGEVEVRGRATSRLSPDDRAAVRAQAMGFVFQDFQLLPERTAVENVALGLLYRPGRHLSRAERRERSRAALTRVGLGHRVDFVPQKLSGGERQRVAIARAIVAEPAIVLCDEPTGNLDTTTSAEIIDALISLNDAGQAIVIVTHDPTVSARAARVVTIVDGHAEEGPRWLTTCPPGPCRAYGSPSATWPTRPPARSAVGSYAACSPAWASRWGSARSWPCWD